MVFPRSAPAPHHPDPALSPPSPSPSLDSRVTSGVPRLSWGAQTLSERGIVQPFRLQGAVPAPHNAIGTHRGTGWQRNVIDQAMQTLETFPAVQGDAHPGSSSGHNQASGQKLAIIDPDLIDPDLIDPDLIDPDLIDPDLIDPDLGNLAHQNVMALQVPHPGWFGPNAPIALDPFGAVGNGTGSDGSITITPCHLQWSELRNALEHGWLEADDTILQADGHLRVTRVQIAPVWYLPGVAKRLQVKEAQLRRALYQATDGLFPDLMTRPDLSIFLPPLAATTVDILGSVQTLRHGEDALAVYIDSRHETATDGTTPYAGWVQALETCIETAQTGGVGVMITLPPQAKNIGSPQAPTAGPMAERLPEQPSTLDWDLKLVPDVLQWLGIRRIDHFLSTSYECSDHLTRSGIEIVHQMVLVKELEASMTAADGCYSVAGPL